MYAGEKGNTTSFFCYFFGEDEAKTEKIGPISANDCVKHVKTTLKFA